MKETVRMSVEVRERTQKRVHVKLYQLGGGER